MGSFGAAGAPASRPALPSPGAAARATSAFGCVRRVCRRALACLPGRSARPRARRLERETGIEPATNSLEGCDSTTELLPPTRRPASRRRRFGGQARSLSTRYRSIPLAGLPTVARGLGLPPRAEVGGEGRTRTFEAARATDLQSAAFDRFATSPISVLTVSPALTASIPSTPCNLLIPGYLEPFVWSWRRDLNPRPADYKSAALPG